MRDRLDLGHARARGRENRRHRNDGDDDESRDIEHPPQRLGGFGGRRVEIELGLWNLLDADIGDSVLEGPQWLRAIAAPRCGEGHRATSRLQ